jgi:hypothetical protein
LATSPLFQLSGFAPGDSSIKTVSVINTDPNNPCQISLQGSGSSNSLTQNISFQIDSIYNKTLADFLSGDSIQIANLQPNQSVQHVITLHFNENADNTDANTNTTFGIKINSQWGSENGTVQGVTTTNTNQGNNETIPPSNELNTAQEDVLGTETSGNDEDSCKITLWWIPLVAQILLTLFILLFNKSFFENPIVKLLFTLSFGVFAFLITKQIGCDCNIPNLCKYIWVLNILLGITPLPKMIKSLTKR